MIKNLETIARKGAAGIYVRTELAPFPGKHPTRWIIELNWTANGQPRSFKYVGKPNRSVALKVMANVRSRRNGTCSIREFDRLGVFQDAYFNMPMNHIRIFHQEHKAYKVYYPFTTATFGLVEPWAVNTRMFQKRMTFNNKSWTFYCQLDNVMQRPELLREHKECLRELDLKWK